MHRLIAALLLSVVNLAACAPSSQPTPSKTNTRQANTTPADVQQRVTTALSTIDPNFKPDYIGAAPFMGFREVIVGGQTLYVSDDGRYLIQAQPYDIQNKTFAVSEGLLSYRRTQLAAVPQSQRIVFAPRNPQYTISVFTDIECGYCRKLHSEITELNKRGIAVEYLAFPRTGLGSQDYKDMISVWCAADRKQALTDAKAGKQIPNKNCNNPVALEYNLGQRIGVNGTPAIFATDGTQLGGYLSPEKLRAMLDKLASTTAKGD
ncbi:MAG TPA: DsbC family protein [Xylella sp.]